MCGWYEPFYRLLGHAPVCVAHPWQPLADDDLTESSAALYSLEHAAGLAAGDALAGSVARTAQHHSVGFLDDEGVEDTALEERQQQQASAETQAGAQNAGVQQPVHKSLDGTFCRINDCKLEYGPFDCEFAWRDRTRDAMDSLTAAHIADAAKCALVLSSPVSTSAFMCCMRCSLSATTLRRVLTDERSAYACHHQRLCVLMASWAPICVSVRGM